MKDELQARVKGIVVQYFMRRRKFVTVTEKELKRFINTIKLFPVDVGKVTVSAKANDAIEVVVLPEILGMAAYTESGTKGLVANVVGGGTAGAIGGGMMGGLVGAPLGALVGAGAGALLTTVAGDSGRARLETAVEAAGAIGGGMMGGLVGRVINKDSCTAEDIFPLLATDGFKKTGDMVGCTVWLLRQTK